MTEVLGDYSAVAFRTRLARHRLPFHPLFLLLAFVAITRLIAAALVSLIPEEAYYWMYAQHPSLSYFDHPPMVAWVIRLGTSVFGQNELGVRVVGQLLSLVTIGLMYVFARLWVNRTASLAAAGAMLVLPVYLWTGFINTMNSQLLFFWLLSLLGTSVALRSRHSWAWTGWYIAGIAFGGALLSKYTGVFVGVGIGLALLLHRPWWKHLRSPHVYLGALLGMAMFAPVLLWNYRHDWASFRFQFVDRAEAHPLKSWLTLWSPLNFMLLQMAAVTPLLFMLWLQTFRQHLSRLRRRPLVVFSLATAVPLLAAMAWKSILFDVHFDWTAPLYLSVLPLAGQTLAARWRLLGRDRETLEARPMREAWQWRWLINATVMVSLAIDTGCLLFLLLIQPATGHPEVFGPWRPLAQVVQQYEEKLERTSGREPLIIGRGKYRLASELAFYRSTLERPASSSAFTTSQWFLGDVDGLGYAYWINRGGWKGRDCIYVSDKDDIAAVVRDRFDHVSLIDDPKLRALPGGITYHLAICRGFRG